MSKWEWKKLGEVCDSINGLWKGKKEPFIKVGVIRNTNFTKNCKLDLNPSKLEFLDVEKKQYDKRKLQFGDLIVEKSGGSEKQPVGRVVLFEEKEGEYSLKINLSSPVDFFEYNLTFPIMCAGYYNDEDFRNFKYATPVIPNTQMIIFKFKNEDRDMKIDWYIELIVLPMDSLGIIAAVIIAVMLVILGVIIFLHVREVKEEQKETNKFKSWFA